MTSLSVARLCAASDLTETPFAPRSGPRGPTMFTELPAQQTGVITENKYADPAMWGARYQEFALGSMGTGVAVGDYDNDGRPDIFVVSKTEPCRLFRNLGNWKFEDVTEAAGLGAPRVLSPTDEPWKQGAAFADVNNDGWLDLYVCRFNAPNLLYINQRDGTFKEEAAARGLAVVDASGMGAFCDYDRDGWLDVFVQTNMLDAATHPNGRPDYLFHNNGDGTFTDVTAKAGISGDTLAHSATWWDFDNDGWPDIYVAKDFGPLDSLYRNNHDGTFTDVANRFIPHTAFSAMGADLGDVDNDGLIDLFVADMAATSHEKDHRGMAASRALSTGSIDGVGDTTQCPRNALLLNTGLGPLREAGHLAGLAATDWTWSVRWEDLDNDGRLDLHVTNGMNREYQNVDLRERIILAETPAERMQIMRSSPELPEIHFAFRNLGDLQFQEVGKLWGLDQKGISFGAAFGDFDGDGDLDLVFANYQKGVTLLRNDSDTGHRLVVALKGHASNRFGVGSLVKIQTRNGVQVRSLVLARGYLSTSEPTLHFGLGEAEQIDRMTIAWPSGREQVFENLAADRRYTIDEPDTPVPQNARASDPTLVKEFSEIGERMNLAQASHEATAQATNQQPLLPFRLDRRGPALAIADLAGEGHDDIVIGGTQAEPARVLLRQDQGRYAATDQPALTAGAIADGPIVVFDVDGDGDNDLLITHGGASQRTGSPKYQPALYLNDGHGAFSPAPADALPPLPICAGAAAVGDFDRDGHLDVFIGARALVGQYPMAPRSALLANRGGRFEDVTDAIAPALGEVGMVTSALWTDVDGDGWIDLLVALDWGSIRHWHNDHGTRLEDWSERTGFAAAGKGWWTSLAAGDFNSDGRMDYVAGNVGLNTQYHASPDAPALIYYGKFGAGSAQQLVEAFVEDGRIYPWRTKKDLSARIPAINKKFPKNDAYSRATIEEILGEPLSAANRFAATEFRSGVFLSQPDGTYKFQPLPRIAQIAAAQGIVVTDVDGDGHADIYLVQNSFAPLMVVCRFDGGISQLLRGDGRGNFKPVEPRDSNLVVQGDAKALVTFDYDDDGWPDFLVSRNNSTTLAYRNNGVAQNGRLRVRLTGPPGNLSAIGARVQLELKDGSQQTAEIQAGSGLYSQSSATVFFGFAEANPPRRVHVRWPSGAENALDVPTGSSLMTIPAPSKDGP